MNTDQISRSSHSEVETIAEDHLGYEVIGGAGQPDTHSEIYFPLRGKIQVDGRENLVLLLCDGIEIRGGANRSVVFEATGDFFGEVVAEFEIGGKEGAQILGQAVNGVVESRIEGKIRTATLLIDDGPHSPAPRVHGILTLLITHLVGEA